MTDPPVLVVVVNWNSPDEAIQCLESLVTECAGRAQIALVDNASTDDSVERICAWLEKSDIAWASIAFDVADSTFDRDPATKTETPVLVVMSSKNTGYAGGNNVGLRFALLAEHEYVFILNDDASIEPGTIDSLVAVTNDPRVGLVGCKIRRRDRPDEVMYQGGSLNYWLGGAGRIRRGLVDPERSGLVDANIVSGAAMLVTREVVQTVGMLNEDYFMYAEDIEFSHRVVEAGWRIRINLDVAATHRPVPGRGHRASAYYYYGTRNLLVFAREHLRGPQRISFFVCFLASRALFLPMWLSRRMWAQVKATLWGVIDFARGRMGRAEYPFVTHERH